MPALLHAGIGSRGRPHIPARVGTVDWDAIKEHLRELVAGHEGRLVDFGLLVELVPPYAGERLRLSGPDPRTVRVETGWFLRVEVDLEQGVDHLSEIVTAVVRGHAREFVSVRDGTPRADGFLVEYPSGSIGARPQFPDRDALQRVLEAWAPDVGPD
jgi:hypothetical protein